MDSQQYLSLEASEASAPPPSDEYFDSARVQVRASRASSHATSGTNGSARVDDREFLEVDITNGMDQRFLTTLLHYFFVVIALLRYLTLVNY